MPIISQCTPPVEFGDEELAALTKRIQVIWISRNFFQQLIINF